MLAFWNKSTSSKLRTLVKLNFSINGGFTQFFNFQLNFEDFSH